jgi:RNA polymerase sigma-70 factor (ECF subfamily)
VLHRSSRTLRIGLAVTTSSPPWRWGWTRERLLREASRYLGPTDAEDAAQEALVRAWRYQASCDDPSNPLPWLLQITRRESLRLLESPRRREIPQDTPVLAQLVDASSIGGSSTDETWDLDQGLSSLTNGERDLLALRFENDLSHAMIAARLGIAEGAVRVRMHRALSKLRRHMEGQT